MTRPVLRFAPSPNGRLHLGHAYSALLNDRVAHDLGGTWLLRLEDIDPVRTTPELSAAVEEDLAWLGLTWPRPVRRQSLHLAEYAAAAKRLRRAGLIYRCVCTRGDIARRVSAHERETGAVWPRDPDGAPVYPGTCRVRPASDERARAGEVDTWRLDVAAASDRLGPTTWRAFAPASGGESIVSATPERWGDVVVVRKDAPTSYHLSVVCDDAEQSITHVVRGRDLEAATDIHALLTRCLGLPSPCYHHHDLLADAAGGKLSKSRRSESLGSLRADGATPDALRRALGFD